MSVTATRVNSPEGSPVHAAPNAYKEVWDVASDSDGGSVNINYVGSRLMDINPAGFKYVDSPANRRVTLTARSIGRMVVLSTQFNKANATLADITGLTLDVDAGKKYKFRAVLNITADTTDGYKFAIGGTATATTIIANVNFTSNADKALDVAARLTALATGTGDQGSAAGQCIIEGEITVNAAGTLLPQFSKNAANNGNNSSVLVGSTFEIETMAHTERVSIISV